MAGNLTVERCGDLFANKNRQCSSNYGVGSDGRIAMYVPEEYRAWTTGGSMKVNGISGSQMDQRAVTIEVANDGGAPDWHISTKALDSLILLCADICKRNGIEKLLWENNKSYVGTDKQNMAVHRWFAAKACPGNYLLEKHYFIVEEANKLIGCYVPPETKKIDEPAAVYYVVQKGDTLYKIAKNYNTTVQAILSLNSNIKNSNLIQPGWKIRVK